MQRRSVLLVVLLLGSVTLAGCAGLPPRGAGGGRAADALPDACSLLTDAEVAGVYGATTIIHKVTSDVTACNYTVPDSQPPGAGGPMVSVRLNVDRTTPEDFKETVGMFGFMGKVLPTVAPAPGGITAPDVGKAGPQPLSGLGDEAYLSGDFLLVRKGNRSLTLTATVIGRTTVPEIDGLKQLAALAVARL
jgi:predicted small secreted protein